jgi:hypothetical protein
MLLNLADPIEIWISFNFFWRHADRISLSKYALTLFCPVSNSEPTMLFLKYYRAASDGRKDASNCDSCFEQNQQLVRPYSYCKFPDACSCTLCNRQPPSLQDIALIHFSTGVCNTLDLLHIKHIKSMYVLPGHTVWTLRNLCLPNILRFGSGVGSICSLTNSIATVQVEEHGMQRFVKTIPLMPTSLKIFLN